MEDKKKLWDIGEIEIDKTLPVKDKLLNFSQSMEEEALEHGNEGYIVRVYFGKDTYTATDAVKQYIKQIAQLKY